MRNTKTLGAVLAAAVGSNFSITFPNERIETTYFNFQAGLRVVVLTDPKL